MSKRDDIILLENIIESIKKIKEYTHNLTVEGFLSDTKTKDAVVRNFEIMGEAVARMNIEFKTQHSNVVWKDLKEFRTILIHANEIIDYALIWDTILNELPLVYKEAKDLLRTLQ